MKRIALITLAVATLAGCVTIECPAPLSQQTAQQVQQAQKVAVKAAPPTKEEIRAARLEYCIVNYHKVVDSILTTDFFKRGEARKELDTCLDKAYKV